MARYLEIDVRNEPFDMGLDANGWPRCGFNFVADKEASDTFAEEIVTRLESRGVGVFGTNIFVGQRSEVPASGCPPFLTLIETAGFRPDRIHNQIHPPAYVKPGMQVVARAKNDYLAARAMARAAYDALQGVRNETLDV